MVFSNLQEQEKDAFFALLDEYFASRPDLLSRAGASGAGAGDLGSTAASAVHRAFASNPEATSRIVSAGLKHGVPKDSQYAAAASNPEITNAVGRVAAASLAFSAPHSSGAPGKPPPPPPTPRRVSSNPSNASGSDAAGKPDSSPVSRGLTPVRRFADVDTSSAKNMYSSLRNSTANKSKVAPPPLVPSAFEAKKNAFAPPPVRSVGAGGPPPPPPRRQPEPEPKPEPEPEEEHIQGEWAEVLYDYSSEEPADLSVRTGEQVFVTERTSEEWWTGQIDGRSGLFPASYVKFYE